MHNAAASRQLGRCRPEPLVERQALDEIADDINTAGLDPDFMHADDVRMSELRGGPGFTQKLLRLDQIEPGLVRALDRDHAIEFGVTRLPHHPETARAQPLDQLEVADRRHLALPGTRRRRVVRGRQAYLTAAHRAVKLAQRDTVAEHRRALAVRAADP